MFNWSKVSHASVFYPPVNNEFWNVIEAKAWTGVTEQHWTKNHKPGTKIQVYRVECTDEQQRIFYQSMRSKIGKGYDYLGIIGFGVRLSIDSVQRWFCSEAVMDCFLKAGVYILKRIRPYKTYPGLLMYSPNAEFVCNLIVPEA